MAELVKENQATVDEEALPAGWSAHQSRSNPGHCYYFNCHTGATTWNRLEVTDVKVTAPMEGLDSGSAEVSGDLPVQKVAEVVQKESAKETETVNNNIGIEIEGELKIAQLEELLQRKREEVKVRSLGGGETAPPCAPSKSGGIGLSSGLRSRRKGDIGLGNRNMAPVKVAVEEILAGKNPTGVEIEPVPCNLKVKQRTKITFSEERTVNCDIHQSWEKPGTKDKEVQEDDSITESSQLQERKPDESEEGEISSDEELYGMDEEEVAKLKSLKSKFVEEEPDNTCAQANDKNKSAQGSAEGGREEGEHEEANNQLSSSDSSPERLAPGTRKRRAGEQLRLIEAMEQTFGTNQSEQTLREKYGYTDETYGQRYIKKDVEEKKRFFNDISLANKL